MNELLSAIKEAPDVVIAHHMRGGGNDFADWIKNSLGKKALANRLKKIKLRENVKATKEKLLKILERDTNR